MKRNVLTLSTLLAIGFVTALAPLTAQASHCTASALAGDWAYTYTGTLYTPDGPLPAASLGHYSSDSSGNITGSQTRTVAGMPAQEDIAGNYAVNKD